MDKKKRLLIVALVILIGCFFFFDLAQYLSLDYFKSQQQAISDFHSQNAILSAGIFVMIYIAVTALSFPGAAVMTLAGGAIFGLLQGTILVSFASTIGATLAFLVSRTLLKESVQKKFADSLKSINAGIEKEGAFYLFGLRLVPLFPFFVINLVMGLTPIKTRQFFLISQLGMLPGTLVYVYTGTQLGQIDSLSGILSPGLLFAFALLGLFPILAKKLMESIQAKKVFANYDKPSKFDTNMVVIGAGSAGLVTSLIAAATKAKVSLIERHKMGGDCLNTGCVPSKALIRSAKMAKYHERAEEFGLSNENIEVDFPAVMERIQSIIKTIEPHDSIERFTGLGVDCITGSAEIIDPFRVKVNGETITTRNIVISTGARPFVPAIKGIEDTGYLTSDTIWELREKPGRMLIIGGGPIGCEMAQSFQRLGVQVIQVDRSARIMPREDEDVSAEVQKRFIEEGIDLRLNHQPTEFITDNGQKVLLCTDIDGTEQRIEYDVLLLAVGRKANTEGFGLDKLNIPLTDKGTIEVNEFLQTRFPNIYACGDVAGPYQFTHTASHQAWYTAVNGLFGLFKKFKADYRVIPWATFSDPEVARVGINEQEAKAQGIAYDVSRYDIDDLDRAIADGEAHGFIKVLTVPGKDKILGVTIVGHHAGDIIAEYVTAMKHGLGLNKILGTIHIYPTLAETNKFVAGNWKKANAPEKVLQFLEKFHAWRRG
ncbi:pyridine nucleotide-disulfide oxidoreductase [Oleiphilus sp. HI0072]|nr:MULTISPECIES: FAD-dependent oxidoreductase [unclassified Oleiphilus]KZY34239.1 pyridine nucleotide-disulfide oxidoreductase [Oleiphilus sp. HI0043]KZY92209.1 pyridine nucleotide-disulfide oxidoreductase [Oleiphilus sp. HI0072]KZZ62558.1 pyridine nucleotide-disulfide oxidoreductase [Oleiphilus sp. HI0128]